MNTTDQSHVSADVAALAWLAGAGVDVLVDAAPHNWLAAAPAPGALAKSGLPERAASAVRAPAAAGAPRATALVVAAADGAATLTDLVTAIAAFNHGLCRVDAAPQPFSGAIESGVLIIGEQPEAPESEAARLRTRMLAAIGLGVEDHGIINLLPWPTLDNGPPREAQLAEFAPFVARALALASPRLLLAFGERAAALAGPVRGMGSIRGTWRDVGGVPMLATFHPRTLLAQPDHKRHAWADLQNFEARLSGNVA